jgi:endonuclease III
MQCNFRLNERPALDEIRARLLATFGSQRDGARLDPLSLLVLAMVRSRTADKVASAAFERLRQRYPAWELLADTNPGEVEALIDPVTDHEIKARFLPRAVLKVVKWSSTPTLDFLEAWDEEPAMQWLQSLPGVGVTIAAAVLNFSVLRKRVLAVDAQLLRVGTRLGLVRATADFAEAHDAIMRRLPDRWDADDLYEFHWLLAHLAQSRCMQDATMCEHCPLRDLCPTGAQTAAPPSAISATAGRELVAAR